jgi:hypothetical protein
MSLTFAWEPGKRGQGKVVGFVGRLELPESVAMRADNTVYGWVKDASGARVLLPWNTGPALLGLDVETGRVGLLDGGNELHTPKQLHTVSKGLRPRPEEVKIYNPPIRTFLERERDCGVELRYVGCDLEFWRWGYKKMTLRSAFLVKTRAKWDVILSYLSVPPTARDWGNLSVTPNPNFFIRETWDSWSPEERAIFTDRVGVSHVSA